MLKLIKLIGRKWKNLWALKRGLYWNLMKIKITALGPNSTKDKFQVLKTSTIIKFTGFLLRWFSKYIPTK